MEHWTVLFPIPRFIISCICSWRGKLARKQSTKSTYFSVDPTWMNMVRITVLGKRRMRKQNSKTTVPLDVVPERRTKRCSPRFRPGGRFCELRFRYPSSPTGREGEISRPLDHMWQIPLIHSTQFTTMWYILVCLCTAYLTVEHAFLQRHSFQRSGPLFKSCCVPYGTRSRILTQNKWHLRKLVCWANEIVHYLVSPYLTLCMTLPVFIFIFQFPASNYFMNTLFVVDSQQKWSWQNNPQESAGSKRVANIFKSNSPRKWSKVGNEKF